MRIFSLILFFSCLSGSLACLSDSDCDIDNYNYCISGTCDHKSLFPNMTDMEIISLFIFFFTAVLTTVAGVGGGVLFYPFLILLLGFTTQESAPMSITIVFFILILRNILCLSERNLYRVKSMINYDIVLVFSPSILIGTIFGVFINAVSSTWFILIFLMIIMTITLTSTLKKALELRKTALNEKKVDLNLTKDAEIYLQALREKIVELDKFYLKDKMETDEIQRTGLLETSQERPEVDLVEIKDENSFCLHLPLKNKDICWNLPQLKRIAFKLEKILSEENKFLDYEKVLWLILNVMLVIILTMLRGTNQISSLIGVEKCSTEFWFLAFAYVPFGLVFMFLVVKFLIKENKWKLECGYIFHKNDLLYDLNTCVLIFFNGLAVGLISTILGIGGAILAAPLLMRLSMETQEASFTASFCALFSSSASVVQYFIAGDIKWDYAGTYGAISVLGMLLGLKGVLAYLKKNNMMYMIPFALVVVMVMTIVLNLTSNISELLTNENSWNFHQYCNS